MAVCTWVYTGEDGRVEKSDNPDRTKPSGSWCDGWLFLPSCQPSGTKERLWQVWPELKDMADPFIHSFIYSFIHAWQPTKATLKQHSQEDAVAFYLTQPLTSDRLTAPCPSSSPKLTAESLCYRTTLTYCTVLHKVASFFATAWYTIGSYSCSGASRGNPRLSPPVTQTATCRQP